MKLSKYNVSEIESAIISLNTNKEFLLKKISKYPLQISFSGTTFTVCSEKEFDSLVQNLQHKITEWYSARSTKASINIIIDAEYSLNDIKAHHLAVAIENHINAHIKNILHSIWEDYDGTGPQLNNVHVNVEDL